MEEPKRKFETDGYVLLRGLFDREETAKIRRELEALQASKKSTLDRPGLTFRGSLCHSSPVVRSLMTSPKIVNALTPILGPDLWIRRDVSVVKQPGGEEFGWHQDNGYNQLLDPYAQLWIALTPMYRENGALSLVPGSHQAGLLPHEMRGTHFIWKGVPHDPVLIEAEPGDALFFSSYILHQSGPNLTKADRIAYLVEFMSRRYFDPYTNPPYLMVSKDGHPDPRFVRFYEGNTSLVNLLRYVVPRTRRRLQILKGRLRIFFSQGS